MAKSYNGWYAAEDLKTRVIEPVPGFRVRIVDNDDVATVFTYLVQQYHARVDDVTKPHPADDWGFYYRPNKNDPTTLSCHSSGTAIDIDATEHPNGVATARTFTLKQIAEVHKILDELDDVIRWGGDYTRTADAMHFEIMATPQEVAQVAARLNDGEDMAYTDQDRAEFRAFVAQQKKRHDRILAFQKYVTLTLNELSQASGVEAKVDQEILKKLNVLLAEAASDS